MEWDRLRVPTLFYRGIAIAVRERAVVYATFIVMVVLAHTLPLFEIDPWLNWPWVPIYLAYVAGRRLWQAKLVGTLVDGPGVRVADAKRTLLARVRPDLMRLDLLQRAERVSTVADCDHPIPFVLEGQVEQHADVRVVLNNEHQHGVARSPILLS